MLMLISNNRYSIEHLTLHKVINLDDRHCQPNRYEMANIVKFIHWLHKSMIALYFYSN